jgi:hypothetical protein
MRVTITGAHGAANPPRCSRAVRAAKSVCPWASNSRKKGARKRLPDRRLQGVLQSEDPEHTVLDDLVSEM